MKELKLKDRIVIEICGNGEYYPEFIEKLLSQIAFQIRDGHKGGSMSWDSEGNPANTEVLWERECQNYGGFRMGNRSLICDAYYGAKQTFEVCCVEREDLENRDFDTSKLTNEDMERIAAKAGDLMLEGCDYWTGVVEAARYWEVPRKDDDVPEVIPGTLGMLNELSIRE